MTGIVQQCGPGEPEDPCDRIRSEVRKLVFQTKAECGERGLRERIMDQIYGKNGPGTPEWEGHDIAITQLKNRIAKLMQDFSDNKCGDGTPIGADAKAWLNRSNPKPSEWKGPNLQKPQPGDTVSKSISVLDWKYWEELTGLTGLALALYLLVSEGSRLFPPRNLVPVP